MLKSKADRRKWNKWELSLQDSSEQYSPPYIYPSEFGTTIKADKLWETNYTNLSIQSTLKEEQWTSNQASSTIKELWDVEIIIDFSIIHYNVKKRWRSVIELLLYVGKIHRGCLLSETLNSEGGIEKKIK